MAQEQEPDAGTGPPVSFSYSLGFAPGPPVGPLLQVCLSSRGRPFHTPPPETLLVAVSSCPLCPPAKITYSHRNNFLALRYSSEQTSQHVVRLHGIPHDIVYVNAHIRVAVCFGEKPGQPSSGQNRETSTSPTVGEPRPPPTNQRSPRFLVSMAPSPTITTPPPPVTRRSIAHPRTSIKLLGPGSPFPRHRLPAALPFPLTQSTIPSLK
ncbi:hypothetical protein Q8A73_006524 [Channa argus]|nr:hypothetical protein Q8A73_006524 [Channa argus]